MDNFTVLGVDCDGLDHVELANFDTETECRRWIDGYTRWGDWGGHDALAIIAPDGEWIETLDAPEVAA